MERARIIKLAQDSEKNNTYKAQQEKYLEENSEHHLEYSVLVYTESDELPETINPRIHIIHRIPTKKELEKKIAPLITTYFPTKRIQQISESGEQLTLLLTDPTNLYHI